MNNLTYDRHTGQILRDGAPTGTLRPDGYVIVWVDNKLVYAHRRAYILQGLEPPPMVDPRNSIRHDCRWSNLRQANNTLNQYNRVSHSKLGHKKGALYNKAKGRWYSMIRHSGKRTYLGTFDSEDEAHTAYMKASEELHGEFSTDRRSVA